MKDAAGVTLGEFGDVAGGRALGRAQRAPRRAFRPPNGLRKFCDDLRPPSLGQIVATSKLPSLISPGAATMAIRSPGGVIRRSGSFWDSALWLLRIYNNND